MAASLTVGSLDDGKNKGYGATWTGGNSWNNQPVKMQISFICDKGAGNGSPSIVSSSGNDWKFNWNTALACTAGGGKGGKSGKITGGGVFLILLFCVPTIYLVAGVIVNKFVRHQSGVEVIPNYAFWGGFFGLIKDGVKFIGVKTCRRGGYSQV